MKMKLKFRSTADGYTLAEVMATLIIATMIAAAVVGMYMGVRRAEQSIKARLEDGFLPMEVLQRIAEDIDRLAQNQADVTITINNKTETGGYGAARIVIENKIFNKENQQQIFDRVVWQSKADPDEYGMILYRAHSGYNLEDKMLDEPKEEFERKLFVPICSGVTLFSIQAVNNEQVTDKWESDQLPAGVKISISFEPPLQDALGDYTIPEEFIYTRTVAADRFKQIAYQFIAQDIPDINSIADNNDADVNEPNESEFEDANDVIAEEK